MPLTAEAGDAAASIRLGLLVNPIAGMGGRVGLKGTDGTATLAEARSRGALPQAGARTQAALASLLASWPADLPLPAVLTAAGEMGQAIAAASGLDATTVCAVGSPSTAADTRHAAAALRSAGVDLLLFAGGDGTARDISAAVDGELAVLGIPAGVKIQSAVFARSPHAAGDLAAGWLRSSTRTTTEREVVDLDEDAYRAGPIAPRLHGYLRVPEGPRLQSRKAPTPASERAAAAGIASALIAGLDDGRRYIVGPGTTTRAFMQGLGLPKTLVGVDVVSLRNGRAGIDAADADEDTLLRLCAHAPAAIVLTPIGGQGFILGRGNQQISPAVLRAVGLDRITVIATPAKLASLGGRPLLVDTGDPALDAELAGHMRVISGSHDMAVVPVEQA